MDINLEKQSGIRVTVYKTTYNIEVIVLYYVKEDKYRTFISSMKKSGLDEVNEASADKFWEKGYTPRKKDWKENVHYKNIKEYMKAMEPVIERYISTLDWEINRE